jgi:hypothetical protein
VRCLAVGLLVVVFVVGVAIGTAGWVVAETGWPWAVLALLSAVSLLGLAEWLTLGDGTRPVELEEPARDPLDEPMFPRPRMEFDGWDGSRPRAGADGQPEWRHPR